MVDEKLRTEYDLVIRGGDVIDPGGGWSGRCDIGISGGYIVDVAPAIPRSVQGQSVDARGCIVVPGLVDLHTHVFAGGSYWGIDPLPIAARSGVTTWIDAGSAGAYNFEAFRRLCIDPSPLVVRAFVNISAIGLVAESGEARSLELCDVDLCAATVERNRDVVVGVKVRIGQRSAGDLGTLPLSRAVEAAAMFGLPVMVHIASGPPSIDDVLKLLRSGDIVTHCATGQDMRLVDRDGSVLSCVREARERGVMFDMGHGVGGFSFSVAQSMIDGGLPFDTISSDAHQLSVLGPMFDLPTCMAKGLVLGMSLSDVVERTTGKPAEVAGLGGVVGRIASGTRADLAVLELQAGPVSYYDTDFDVRTGSQRLVSRCTVSAGRLLPTVEQPRMAPWVRLSDDQSRIGATTGRTRAEAGGG